ncbi:MAG TPA: hypothetical protein VNN06_10580 [Ramlibacter sp.]|nr:hypothetical protein [Ramlibacter sp.]
MSKIIPVVPSFTAWQRAAERMLTLETTLARGKRALPMSESTRTTELETAAARARVISDQLFQIAFAEVQLTRGKQQAPCAPA